MSGVTALLPIGGATGESHEGQKEPSTRARTWSATG